MKLRPLSLLLLLALSVPLPAAAREAAVRPPLWKLSDADTTIYLFGTVHALPKSLVWRTGKIEQAFGKADTLVVEVVEPDDMQAAAQPMLAMGMNTPGLPPLAERVPEGSRAALKALIGRSPFPAAVLDKMETWLAAVILVGPQLVEAGLDPESGADKKLIADARKRAVKLIGLETMEQQLGYFDSLPEEDQRALLKAVIDDDKDMRGEMDKLIASWAKGDTARLALLADDELKATPHLKQVLLTARNARWADWLQKRLGQPGTVFMAVGAGHLTGDDSVQRMLAAKGFKVERLQ